MHTVYSTLLINSSLQRWMFKLLSVILRGMRESKRDRKRRSRKEERMHLPPVSLKRISWCGSRGAGETDSQGEQREREDKSTAALSPFSGERPAVCAERPPELTD